MASSFGGCGRDAYRDDPRSGGGGGDHRPLRRGLRLSELADFATTAAGLSAHPDLEAALAAAFDAVVAPDLWPQVTEDLARAFGGLAICFHRFGKPGSRLAAPMSGRYRDMLTEFIAGGWAAHDLRARRGWPMMRAGRMMILEDDVSTPEERARLPIYAELLRRHDMELVASVGVRRPGELWSVNVVRSERMGPLEPEALRRMQLAQPHLARLLGFAEAMAQSARLGALGALEHSAAAAMVIDEGGRVGEMNRPAEALLGAGLSVRGGRLCAQTSDGQAALDGLVAAALGGAGVGERPVCLSRDGRAALLVDAVPCRGRMADAFGRSGAILMVTDLERPAQPSQALLRRLYGLTAREAEVAALVGAGSGVDEVSDRLGLQASSVRQLVKAVLAKTGLGRQVELAALVARLPATR